MISPRLPSSPFRGSSSFALSLSHLLLSSFVSAETKESTSARKNGPPPLPRLSIRTLLLYPLTLPTSVGSTERSVALLSSIFSSTHHLLFVPSAETRLRMRGRFRAGAGARAIRTLSSKSSPRTSLPRRSLFQQCPHYLSLSLHESTLYLSSPDPREPSLPFARSHC